MKRAVALAALIVSVPVADAAIVANASVGIVARAEAGAKASNKADQIAPNPAALDQSADAATTVAAPARVRPTNRLPPFAPQLSAAPVIASPSAWQVIGRDAAWRALIKATPATRQAARWAYARNEIALGRAAEALGVLDVMRQDEPDIVLAPSFQLALGATLTLLSRPQDAMIALGGEALASNPEACMWRMRALAQGNLPGQALGQVRCALPALNARHVAERSAFLLPVALSAIDLAKPAIALQLLHTLPPSDSAANVLRGRAELALGHLPEGRHLLELASQAGSREDKLDAELSLLEDAARRNALGADAPAKLDHIRYVWRGGDIEARALWLSYRIARARHDLRATLEAGATLFRYFNGGRDGAALITELRQTLASALEPGNPMPLDQIAGLYWDYRDLSPAAADGDLLVSKLADLLQGAGLYERAAELLEHQLLVRTQDIAQGPLSAHVATLFILAGQPARALAAIRNTDGNNYPDDMLWDRHRVEAVALDQLGRTDEALAALQDVPDGDAIREEIYWRRRNWAALVAATPPAPVRSGKFTEVVQARVLRYAIALAMLGREEALARLHGQYSAAFAKLPTAAAFEALTATVGTLDPAAISAAMAAIPSASPAGEIGDLMEAAPGVSGAGTGNMGG